MINLTAKPPWTDEFATMVFSLGNDYQSIPLDQIISLETLLQPLQANLQAKVPDIISLVIHQDNHPPLYFVLAHLWLKLFPSNDLESLLWFSRLLPALFGTLCIPSIYLVIRWTWGSLLIADLTAMLMAFSPYAVFLSQEARQYSLAILLVIFSFGCLLIAIKETIKKKNFSWWLVFFWIVINALGLTVHYFFSLTLVAEVLSLLLFYFRHKLPLRAIKKLFFVFLLTATTGLVWAWFAISSSYGQNMTTWIYRDNSDLFSLIKPLFQILAAWLTMLCLLPVESPFLPIILFSGLLMLFFFCWITPGLYKGIKKALILHPLLGEVTLSFIFCSIALFFLLTYFVGIDITRGARYSFVYFPAVIILLGVALSFYSFTKKELILVSLVVFCSAITVVFNLGYGKYYRPDLFFPILESNSPPGVVRVIATPYKSLVQIGEMMGLAWVLNSNKTLLDTRFLFSNHRPLPESLAEVGSNFDLWLVNFDTPLPTLGNCQSTSDFSETVSLPSVNGYAFSKYQC